MTLLNSPLKPDLTRSEYFMLPDVIVQLSRLWNDYLTARAILQDYVDELGWQEIASRSRQKRLESEIRLTFDTVDDLADEWGFVVRRCLDGPFRSEATQSGAFSLCPVVAKVERQFDSANGRDTHHSWFMEGFPQAPFSLLRYAHYEKQNLTEGETRAIATALASWLVATKGIAHQRLVKGSMGPENAFIAKEDLTPEAFWSDIYCSIGDIPAPPPILERTLASEAEERQFIEYLNQEQIPAINRWCDSFANGAARRLIREFRPREIDKNSVSPEKCSEFLLQSDVGSGEVSGYTKQFRVLWSRFTEREKLALYFKEIEGLDAAEVAQKLNIPRTSVYQAYQNIRREKERIEKNGCPNIEVRNRKRWAA